MFIKSFNRKQIRKDYPNVTHFIRYDGGYMIFFSGDDYRTWKNQK